MASLPPASQLDRAKRRGARLGIIAFALFVASFTVVWSVQILTQAWAAPVQDAPAGSCREQLLALISAVDRARAAAVPVDDERAALARFRGALEPAWSARPALERHCEGDGPARAALPEIDEFRYAEEHAVRRDLDLSRHRQRARELERNLSIASDNPR